MTIVYTFRVKYYETDKMGIVHHSNYIRYMEDARVHALHELGTGFSEIEARGLLSPVLSVSCEYKLPFFFDDEVFVYTKLLSLSGARYEVSYEMKDKDGVLHAVGRSSHCFTDKEMKPVRLKKCYPDIYELYSKFLEDSTFYPRLSE